MRVESPAVEPRKGECMKLEGYGLLVCLLLSSAAASVWAQTAAPPAPPGAASQEAARLEQKVETISAALAVTQLQIEQSQRQMQQLQQELLELRRQMASTAAAAPAPSRASSSVPSSESPNVLPVPPASDAISPALEERLQTLEAAVKLHDQTKVESSSKYPVRLTGLMLLNVFLNK